MEDSPEVRGIPGLKIQGIKIQTWGTRLALIELLQVDGRLQRQILRGTANHDGVVSRKTRPSILLLIKDREKLGVDFQGYSSFFAGFEVYLAPANKALGWLLRGGG